jgi:hypothetical protein
MIDGSEFSYQDEKFELLESQVVWKDPLSESLACIPPALAFTSR